LWKCRTDRGPVVGDRYQVRGRSDGDGLLLSAYKDRADEQDEHQKPDRARQDPLAPRRLPSPRLQRAGVEQRLGVSDQVIKRAVNPFCVLTRHTALHRLVGAKTKEHGIVVFQHIVKRNFLANIGAKHKLDTHSLKYPATRLDHLVFQLEFGDTKRQQTAYFGMLVIDNRLDTIARQDIRARQSRRAGAYNRHLVIGLHHA